MDRKWTVQDQVNSNVADSHQYASNFEDVQSWWRKLEADRLRRLRKQQTR